MGIVTLYAWRLPANLTFQQRAVRGAKSGRLIHCSSERLYIYGTDKNDIAKKINKRCRKQISNTPSLFIYYYY